MVISSIPYYAMQSTCVPYSTSLEFEKLQRTFICGHLEGNRKIHIVNWNAMSRPKSGGGLGIKKVD